MFLKITATERSNAVRNSAELQDVLVTTHGSRESMPPILILYNEGDPEHWTTPLSVKFCTIMLFQSLNYSVISFAGLDNTLNIILQPSIRCSALPQPGIIWNWYHTFKVIQPS